MKNTTAFRFLLVNRALLAVMALTGTAAPRAYGLNFTVNTRSDTHDFTAGDGQCADGQGKCSLRAAIEEISRFPEPRVITLPAGTYNLTLVDVINSSLQLELEINASMSIRGAGSNSTFINGNHKSRIFHLGQQVPNRI
jgi:CSLREA domain-containing protein